jgi:hypothetical protein
VSDKGGKCWGRNRRKGWGIDRETGRRVMEWRIKIGRDRSRSRGRDKKGIEGGNNFQFLIPHGFASILNKNTGYESESI